MGHGLHSGLWAREHGPPTASSTSSKVPTTRIQTSHLVTPQVCALFRLREIKTAICTTLVRITALRTPPVVQWTAPTLHRMVQHSISNLEAEVYMPCSGHPMLSTHTTSPEALFLSILSLALLIQPNGHPLPRSLATRVTLTRTSMTCALSSTRRSAETLVKQHGVQEHVPKSTAQAAQHMWLRILVTSVRLIGSCLLSRSTR